jgi:glycosyltransferase involved in cell wall biosynthesis
MKILIVGQFIEPPFAEGITNIILNWSRALSEANVDFQVLSLSSKYSGHQQIFGINFEYLKTKNPRFQITLSDLFALQRAVVKRSKKVDVVHYALNADAISYIPSLSLLKLKNSKTVNSYHNTRVLSTRFFRNTLFDAITVPSKRMFTLFKQKTPSQKIKIIQPCVDTSLFQPRNKIKVREELSISQEDFLIFTVGHFKRGRRLLPLVQTIEELTKKRENIQLLVGWTGHGKEGDIKEAFATFKKKKFVKVLPPTDLINLYYNAIDVYVLSAQSDYVIETPMSILEALSSGVPVLSFNINATPEIIENGVNGYLVEDGNFNEMKTTLELLIEDGSLLKELSKNARTSILNNFSYKVVGRQLKKFYTELTHK